MTIGARGLANSARSAIRGLALVSGVLAPIVAIAASLAQTVAVVWVLGVGGRGVTAQAAVICGLAALIGNIGLESAVMNAGVRGPSAAAAAYLSSMKALAVISAPVLVICTLALAVWPGLGLRWRTVLACSAAAATSTIILPSVGFLRVLGNARLAQWIPPMSLAIPMAASSLAVLLVHSTDGAMLGWACGMMLLSAVVLAPTVRAAGRVACDSDRPDSNWRSLVRFGVTGHFGAVVQGVMPAVPLLMLGHRSGPEVAGQYSLVSTLVAGAALVGTALVSGTLAAAARDPSSFAQLKRTAKAAQVWSATYLLLLAVVIASLQKTHYNHNLSWFMVIAFGPFQMSWIVWSIFVHDLAVRGYPGIRSISAALGFPVMLMAVIIIPDLSVYSAALGLGAGSITMMVTSLSMARAPIRALRAL